MGYGKHLWYLPMGQDIPLLKALYALSIFYIGVQSMSKISLLLLFKRIYPSPRFRLCCEAGIIFVTLHCVAFTISIIFQCSPINSYWDHRIKRKCLNSTAIGYAGAVFSILEDFVILGMPIPQLLRLQVKTGQKIALILLFSVGSLYATFCKIFPQSFYISGNVQIQTTNISTVHVLFQLFDWNTSMTSNPLLTWHGIKLIYSFGPYLRWSLLWSALVCLLSAHWW